MIERHISVTTLPDRTGAFEAFFAGRYGPTMAKAPGFVAVSLLRELDSPTRYQMVLRWADAESAVGWRTSAAHEALQPALTGLYADAEVQIQAYEVVV
jgi:heme-degrading monooxygenase HmoA